MYVIGTGPDGTGPQQVNEVGTPGNLTASFIDPTGGAGIAFGASGSNAQFITTASGWKEVRGKLTTSTLLVNAILAIGWSTVLNDNANVQAAVNSLLTAFGAPGTIAAANAFCLTQSENTFRIVAADSTSLIKSFGAAFSGGADIANLFLALELIS